jgi:hypothetical protein
MGPDPGGKGHEVWDAVGVDDERLATGTPNDGPTGHREPSA